MVSYYNTINYKSMTINEGYHNNNNNNNNNIFYN